MPRFFTALLLLFCLNCFAQQPSSTIQLPDTTSLRESLDSTLRTLDSLKDKAVKRSAEFNNTHFYTLKQDSVAKQKRDAFIRIGLGIFFLLVLIIGLRRRAKKK